MTSSDASRAARSTDWAPEAYHRRNDWGRRRPYLKHVAGLPYDMIESGEGGLLRVAGKLVLNSAPLSEDRAGKPCGRFPCLFNLRLMRYGCSAIHRGGDSRCLGPAKSDECSKVVLLLVF